MHPKIDSECSTPQQFSFKEQPFPVKELKHLFHRCDIYPHYLVAVLSGATMFQIQVCYNPAIYICKVYSLEHVLISTLGSIKFTKNSKLSEIENSY